MRKFQEKASMWIGAFHPLPKKLLRYGLLLIAVLYGVALVLFLCAGRAGEYYVLMRWCHDFLTCAGDTLTAVLVPGLFLEVLIRAKEHDEQAG